MMALRALIHRNVKLFFREKGLFLTALITPVILLVLYTTFLGRVYYDNLAISLPEGAFISEELLRGLVNGQLISSLLAVSSVTVGFTTSFLSVHDKAHGRYRDLLITPVKTSTLAAAYYVAALISTLIITYSAVIVCLLYLAVTGFFLTVADVLLLVIDVTLLSLLGTALSSVISLFLSSQGQISAIGSIVSSGYGFISGAYMPLSSFGEGLRRLVMFFPGTYGTSLLRSHATRGVLENMRDEGLSEDVTRSLSDMIDASIYFPSGEVVGAWASYLILCGSILLLLAAYVLINAYSGRRARR